MIKEHLTITLNRIKEIQDSRQSADLLWTYFDLIKDICIATGLRGKDGGNGNKFILTIRKDFYDKLAFTIGKIRVLGIGYRTGAQEFGISFVFPFEERIPKRDNWHPWKWSTYKGQKVKDKTSYLTTNPDDLRLYGEIRLRWMESVLEIAAERANNTVEYNKHRPLLYNMAMDSNLRSYIFREAGVTELPEWAK